MPTGVEPPAGCCHRSLGAGCWLLAAGGAGGAGGAVGSPPCGLSPGLPHQMLIFPEFPHGLFTVQWTPVLGASKLLPLVEIDM